MVETSLFANEQKMNVKFTNIRMHFMVFIFIIRGLREELEVVVELEALGILDQMVMNILLPLPLPYLDYTSKVYRQALSNKHFLYFL